MDKYIVILALVLIQGCSSSNGGSEDTPPVPVAKVFITNNYSESITSVSGVSSVGTQQSFVITTTDVNDATPNIIESGEVGVIEITECDVMWKMSYTLFNLVDFTSKVILEDDMSLYSCNTEYEYTCRIQSFDFFGEPVVITQCIFGEKV